MIPEGGDRPGAATDVDRTRRPYSLEEATAILARTPAVLDTLLRNLPDEWLNAHEGDSTWSPFDVVGHLTHAERTNWLPRATTILGHGDSRPFDDFDRLGQFAPGATRTIAGRLDEFAAARRKSLQALMALTLTESDLALNGRHPAFGTVTLRQLLSAWVVHDLDHIMQIVRVLATQYADEVGPWREYLRIVR